ncbi:hypothetical protein ACFOG5_06460 [Pedobacter fastidiosus]|uniref:PH domain-containing protein n=1 Tax=Pedobacter fastidiosus TaxID=2765361 RepID=A0ABR7KV29_9SPHI|nr:hypothetical protein [Pedobacter fastidiosus]MBC6111917.1 hypothetical protein [Pedobacter fastidiosus]
MKIWVNKVNEGDRIIAIDKSIIYKGNPSQNELDSYVMDLNSGKIPTKKIRGIPLNYLKRISTQKGKPFINLELNGGSDFLVIKNQVKKDEILKYLRENIPNSEYSLDRESIKKAVEKPIIAMAVIWLFFIFSFILAIKMESGDEYDVSNGHSILGIVFILAHLGTMKLSILFAILFSATVIVFLKKKKRPPIFYKLERSK